MSSTHAKYHDLGCIQGLLKIERGWRIQRHERMYVPLNPEFKEWLLNTDIEPGTDWLGNKYVRETENAPKFMTLAMYQDKVRKIQQEIREKGGA